MPRSDWLLIATLIGCLALAALGLRDSQRRARYFDDNGVSACSNAAPQAYKRLRNLPRGCDYFSAKAAIIQAEAAEDGVSLGFIQTLIGACGLLYVLRTFRQTQLTADAAIRGVEQSKRTADAAHEQVAISDLTTKAELRAYIGIESVSIGWIDPNAREDKKHSREVIVQIRNFGQSPAQKVMSGIKVLIIPMDGAPLGGETPRQLQHDIMPSSNLFIVDSIVLEDVEIEGLHGGTLGIFVYFWFRYDDVFGAPYAKSLTFYSSGVIFKNSKIANYHNAWLN